MNKALLLGNNYSFELDRFVRQKLEYIDIDCIPNECYSVCLVFPEMGKEYVLDDTIQKLLKCKKDIICSKAKLSIICGMSECCNDLQKYLETLTFLTVSTDIKTFHVNVILDRTVTGMFNIGAELENRNYVVWYTEGFRNLCWGVDYPDRDRVIETVNENIRRYLFTRGEGENSLFIRVRRPDSIRDSVFRYLNVNGLLEKSIYTYNYAGNGPYSSASKLSIPFNRSGNEYDQSNNGGYYVHNYNFDKVRQDFFCELVVEHERFVSEKSYKPMLLALPCFFFGKKGVIKELHREGFLTFDRWWDESYDEYEECDIRKLECIGENIKYILGKTGEDLYEIYVDMIPVFEHNAQILSRKSFSLEEIVRGIF